MKRLRLIAPLASASYVDFTPYLNFAITYGEGFNKILDETTFLYGLALLTSLSHPLLKAASQLQASKPKTVVALVRCSVTQQYPFLEPQACNGREWQL